MPKHALKKTAAPSKKRARAAKGAACRTTFSGRFLSSSEDVAEFEAAARAYSQKHTKDKGAALKALRAMGMVTPSGRLTKRYLCIA